MAIFVVGSFIQACCWGVHALPRAGESVAAHQLHIEAGGKGLNVAVAASRLGADVATLVGLGEDEAANTALQVLQSHGVGPIFAPRLAGRSGHGAGLIAADGQNMVSVYLGANLLLDASHVATAADRIQTAAVVYAQFETSLPAITTAFELAYQHGGITILNPSPWQTIPTSLLAATSVLVVNQPEACQLLGWQPARDIAYAADACQPDLMALQSLMQAFITQWQGHLLIVTLGQAGCAAITREHTWIHMPAFKVTAVDSLGAGDSFAAGLCVALDQGLPVEAALRFANACGAVTVKTPGVLAALPTLTQVSAMFDPLNFTSPA